MYKFKKPLPIIAFVAMAVIVYLWIDNNGGYEPIAFVIDAILIPLIYKIKDKKHTLQAAQTAQDYSAYSDYSDSDYSAYSDY